MDESGDWQHDPICLLHDLDSLMNKKRYVESYLFNLTNKINNNQNNENILSMALSQVDNKNI